MRQKSIIAMAATLLFSVACITAYGQGDKVSVDGNSGKDVFYMFDKFVDGTVMMKSGSPIKAKLNYNTYSAAVEFIDENGERMALSAPEDVAYINMGEHTFYYINNQYMEIEVVGKISLSSVTNATISDIRKEGPYGMKSSTMSSTSLQNANIGGIHKELSSSDEVVYQIKKTYYVSNGKRLVFANAKGFEKLLSKHKEEIRGFIDSNKIDFTDGEQLKKLVEYCNRLE